MHIFQVVVNKCLSVNLIIFEYQFTLAELHSYIPLKNAVQYNTCKHTTVHARHTLYIVHVYKATCIYERTYILTLGAFFLYFS